MSYTESIFLLFSYEFNKKKKIYFSKGKILRNIILENQLNKEEKNYIIELYEIKIENSPLFFFTPYINIKIDNYELSEKILRDEMFIFNEKKDLKVNCLSIEEEFNFYYEFIKKDKDNSQKTFNSLIQSILRILKENNNHSTFSLLLNIITKEEFNKSFILDDIEKILINTDKKGDISKINKDKLFLKIENGPIFKEKNPFTNFFILYMILENREELRYLLNKGDNRIYIFDCLYKFKKLLKNYIKIIPDYYFLIDEAYSNEVLYNIFYYIKNLYEFILLLNAKKEHIFQLIFENEKDFRIEKFIKYKKDIFNEKFDESFYISLISINEYKSNNYKERLIIGFRRDKDYGNIIRYILFHFFISNLELYKSIDFNYIYKSKLKGLNEYNNMEIIGLICIYIIYQIRSKYNLEIIEDLISILNNRKISDECIKCLEKIDFNKDYKDIKYNKKIISVFLKNMSNIKLYYNLI